MGKASRGKKERKEAKAAVEEDILDVYKKGGCLRCGRPRDGKPGVVWCKSCTAAGHAVARSASPLSYSDPRVSDPSAHPLPEDLS